MKQVQKRMLKLLEEGVKHFNSNNRGMHPDFDVCVYVPPKDCNSDGCFIGRLLPQKHKKFVVEQHVNEASVGTIFYKMALKKVEIPRVFRGIPETFLQDCQSLHDESNNWTPEGLSVRGEVYARDIRRGVVDNHYA